MKRILTLSPDTFIWINKHDGVVYNAKYHKAFEFKMTTQLYDLCLRLLDYDNLYSVEYNDDNNDSSIIHFIEDVVAIGAGLSHEENKIIFSLPPLLNIQHDYAMQELRDFESQDYALRYLTKIVLYIGGECDENIFYMQTEYPINTKSVLRYTDIVDFIQSTNSRYISEICIVFSDLYHYTELDILLECLVNLNLNITICLRDQDSPEIIKRLILSFPEIKVKLLYKPGNLRANLNLLDCNVVHTFLISSEEDYARVDSISGKYSDEKIDFIPVYTGKNYDFFRDNVLLTKEEILSSNLTRRGVYMHQVLNTNYFGTLFVMPNKKVFSSVLSPPLGNISDSIYSLILEEMSKNYSWRKTRNQTHCKDCVLKYLCPSPSNYEKLMNLKCICTDIGC